MPPEPIRFEDGAAYEHGMGIWSQKVGRIFLDWIAPPPGQHWIDVGCGNGAFTELLLTHTQPASVQGVDPSPAQISYAQSRPGAASAHFQVGDAMALPFEPNRFDIAVMALVIFFVPDPRKGVEEMIRVVRPGGRIAAYVWDVPSGGLPVHPLQEELRAEGLTPSMPPQAPISAAPALHALWSDLGLEAIEARSITVERVFPDFDDFWEASTAIGSIKATLGDRSPDFMADFKARVRRRIPAPDAEGRITLTATANAIVGRKRE